MSNECFLTVRFGEPWVCGGLALGAREKEQSKFGAGSEEPRNASLKPGMYPEGNGDPLKVPELGLR